MRVLENWDVSSLYPNLIRLYDYSSRNQKDRQSYVNLLSMRMKAKHGQLSDDFLKPLGLTNGDLKMGLKLPLNAYSGALRAVFNTLYDNLQGFSICTTGQLFILQLIHDLLEVPTLEMVSANTDACMYTVEEEHKEQAHAVLHAWEKLTGLELEEDKIVKIVMRNVNNYCEIVQTGDNDYEIHYKGGELTHGDHHFTWNKDKKIFEYEFSDSLKSNSMTIVSEAILKQLLFDIPVEDTINKCDDIFRFQIITHLGSTYEKMVQEMPDGDVELQRNNRVYAGKEPTGPIMKVKENGRRDSLASQPPNPIVDNANKLTIDYLDKLWYIEIANEKVNDFLGIKRIEDYKKDELLDLAKELNLDIDKKMKKADLIKLIKEKKKGNEITKMATKQELETENAELKEKLSKSITQNEQLVEKIKGNGDTNMDFEKNDLKNLYKKINKLRENIRKKKFIFDKELPRNLGSKEYYSIEQFYDVLQEECLNVGLDFKWEVTDVLEFYKELVKPSNGQPIHVATIETKATITDIDTGCQRVDKTIDQGSDTMDKAISGASTLAFRHWFVKNFTPKDYTDDDQADDTPKSEAPKVPAFIPEKRKEEIKKVVVKQEQPVDENDDDIKDIMTNIMKIRDAGVKDSKGNLYGTSTLAKLQNGGLDAVELETIRQKVMNKMEKENIK